MSSTRYNKSQPNYRLEQYKRALQDRPVAIASEEYEDDGDEEEKKTYYCNYCSKNLAIQHLLLFQP